MLSKIIKFISISTIQPPLDGVKSPCVRRELHPPCCADLRHLCILQLQFILLQCLRPSPGPSSGIQASLKKLHVTCSLFLSLAQCPQDLSCVILTDRIPTPLLRLNNVPLCVYLCIDKNFLYLFICCQTHGLFPPLGINSASINGTESMDVRSF